MVACSGIVTYIEKYCQDVIYTRVQGEVFEWLLRHTDRSQPKGIVDQFMLNALCRDSGSGFRVLYLGSVVSDSASHSPDGVYIIFPKILLNALLGGFIAGLDTHELEVCKQLKALALGQTNVSLLQDARR